MGTRWMPIICTVGAGLALGLFVLACASTHTAETQAIAENLKVNAAVSNADAGPVEGLKVHGHWTIEVRDPDGTLVEHREFENALSIGEGDVWLANVLGRASTVGGWQIQVGSVSLQICQDASGNPINCSIYEATSPLPAGNFIFKNLTASSSSGTVLLSGSLTAQADGQIEYVFAINDPCPSSVSPDNCPGDPSSLGDALITNTSLGTPIAVQTGQQVQVNVAISFS